MMSSDGDTNFCSLSRRQQCAGVRDRRASNLLLAVLHTRLQDLAVEFETLDILLLRSLFWRRNRLDLRVRVAGAEDVGRHCVTV